MTEGRDGNPANGSALLPIACQLDNKLGLFCITRAKGKTLSSGGFGVAISTGMSTLDGNLVQTGSDTTHQYLFVEEVLFLHERGLLECRDVSMSEVLDTSQLYQLLSTLQISLPIYFVYAHLRSQDFRVLRHNPIRIEILRKHHDRSSDFTSKDFKRKIRTTLEKAPAPIVPEGGLQICFDVYMPNASFSKLNPGLPDFFVATTYFGISKVSFQDCQKILRYCDGIRLKVATVSDSGTVVMFGLTDFGVPTLKATQERKRKSI